MIPFSHDYLWSVLHYEPKTGKFFWTQQLSKKRPVGSEAGPTEITIHGVRCSPYHVAWVMMTGEDIPLIDHKNGDRSDNSFDNLRPATPSQNRMNSLTQSNNKSGIKGVIWDSFAGKWRAQITVNGVKQYLGRFATLEEAESAVDKVRAELHGDFSYIGRGAR